MKKKLNDAYANWWCENVLGKSWKKYFLLLNTYKNFFLSTKIKLKLFNQIHTNVEFGRTNTWKWRIKYCKICFLENSIWAGLAWRSSYNRYIILERNKLLLVFILLEWSLHKLLSSKNYIILLVSFLTRFSIFPVVLLNDH